MMAPLRLLVSAYACEPDRGSEAEVGWNWVRQAARYHDVWVITRTANREAIEAYEVNGSTARIRWIYYDLPWWLRAWKRRRRGLHLYYVLWQWAIYRRARHLHRTVRFDLVHHVTFATYWMPSFLAFLGVPFMWGPLGGGESAPRSFYRTLPLRGRIQEHFRDAARWCAERTPLLRAVAQSAGVAFATTEESADALRRIGASRVHVVSQVALSSEERVRLAAVPFRDATPFRVVSVGNLLALKGWHLGLGAFSELVVDVPDSEYWLVGDGPERSRLEALASRLGIASRVTFTGAVPRARVPNILAECDVLMHPSLHDSGGYACIEALACGRPVICLDLGGPGTLVDADCGIKVVPASPAQTRRDLAAALRRLAGSSSLRARLGETARRTIADRDDWNRKGDWIYGEYARRLAAPRSDAA